jgi:hypothetical protein
MTEEDRTRVNRILENSAEMMMQLCDRIDDKDSEISAMKATHEAEMRDAKETIGRQDELLDEVLLEFEWIMGYSGLPGDVATIASRMVPKIRDRQSERQADPHQGG